MDEAEEVYQRALQGKEKALGPVAYGLSLFKAKQSCKSPEHCTTYTRAVALLWDMITLDPNSRANYHNFGIV